MITICTAFIGAKFNQKYQELYIGTVIIDIVVVLSILEVILRIL